jgi:hypothetical protein
MKILYIASNPENAVDLNLPREINELQRSATTSPGAPSSFDFLPALKVEDLPGVLRDRIPDILHLAAHGDNSSLSLADEAGNRVALTAEMLVAFLPRELAPRIIYLNACNSHGIAKALVDSGRVDIAIGSTAPITNRTARAAAVAFYEGLLAGETVGVAFAACQSMIRLLAGNKASAKVYTSAGVDLSVEVMHRVPTIVAEFDSGKPKRGKDNHYRLNLGLLGCPPTTVQIVFFTNDETFVTDEDTIEEDLCSVLRTAPVNGAIWMEDEYWKAEGDYRLFAVGVKADGGHFTVASTLCKALERRYRPLPGARLPAAINVAINNLLKNNGERAHAARGVPTVDEVKTSGGSPSKRKIGK